MEFFFILLCMIVQKGHSESLGEADPQFSSPSRIKIFEDDTSKETVAEDRMDPGNISGIDPALLQAVLADPVLLQAVDPRVLQAVLVSAAAANLAIPNIPSLQVTTPVPVFPTSPKLLQQGPPKLGHPFTNVRDQNREPFPEKPRNVFAERPQNTQNQFRPQEQQKLGSAFKAVPSLSHQAQNTFQQPKLSQNTNIFGEFDPQKQNTNIQLNSDVEFIVEDFSGNKAEKLLFENQRTVQVELPNLPNPQQFERQVENPVQSKSTLPLGFTSQELLKTLQENPAVARQLAEQMQTDPSIAKSLGLTFGQPAQPKLSANLVLPPQPSARQVLPPPGPQAGVCSLITRNGIPCDPGLAFNPSTGSCEWPDMLIEAGCNPEVVTGFGPCPQDATDPHLNPSQILSWPYPKYVHIMLSFLLIFPLPSDSP